MSVRIQLDRPHAHFTNLDQISGIIILQLVSPETISEITVKLEGESRSRLVGPANTRGTYDPYERNTALLEVHKLLYKVATVFPTQDLLRASGPSGNYTLPPGQHVYPFNFKLPFNNDCSNNNSLLNNLSSLRLDMVRPTDRHVKKTLPPTLSGLPGEAEIRYYVKTTVARPAFYKENFRSISPFTFLPIEPPRQPANKRESFARRSHHFSPAIDVPDKPGFFRKDSAPSDTNVPRVLPPIVSVDGRLPDPAIVTCNEPLPLRVLITKKNETPATIFLQLLNINLIAYTIVRAHELVRKEANVWTILSKSNLKSPLTGALNNDGNQLSEIDSKLWKQLPLPNTVSPSFETCNISRNYELEIKVGLQWGSARSINPELQVVTLRMPVQVFSGISPPQQLLDQMASRPGNQGNSYVSSNLRPPGGSVNDHVSGPSRPPGQTQQPSDHIEPSPSDIPDVAPPSYEDAMADDLAPVDGPRRDYALQSSVPTLGESEKRAGDERLFP